MGGGVGGSFKCNANMAANQTVNRAADPEGGSREDPCYDFREQIRQEAAEMFSKFRQTVRSRLEAEFT